MPKSEVGLANGEALLTEELQQPSIGTAKDGVLAGGGETGARMRSFDWSRTALGSVETWPQALKTSVSICLNSRFAIVVWWGRELVKLYNDSYVRILGSKHPGALGAAGREVWPEIWHIIGPMLEGVLDRADATWSDNLQLILERNGYPEECYFTFSYSPIRDETGAVVGVFSPVQETTLQVIGDRRLHTLRELGEAARASNTQTREEVCRVACNVVAKNPYDVPFAAFYLLSADGREARFSNSTPVPPQHRSLIPASISLSDPDTLLAEVVRSGRPAVLPLPEKLRGISIGAWPVAPREFVVLPLGISGQRAGFALFGVSPRKQLDDDYRSFLTLLAGQVTTAITEADVLETERRRGAALAEIDRAETAFFSNVSHEFRTPLTLMLGPLEDTLEAADSLPADARESLEVAHRNSLRLLRLVNTLLDFSRIEAGRVQAAYESTDLSAVTADLASIFRSAVEKAGLELVVDCRPIGEPVFIDREMWEKIVLNLLSNAFKYTLDGEIRVTMQSDDGYAVLSVTDTGTGIPEHELSHLFERFHRVEGARGRTQEGSGIGLALVAELVRLHGGTVSVTSRIEVGSTFTVSIPFGTAHLSRDRIITPDQSRSEVARIHPYIEEALRWLPEQHVNALQDATAEPASGPVAEAGVAGRVLVADDNADMRGYVRSLLAGHYAVDTVANGVEALASVAANRPDLIVSDVMMPELDGFGLLRVLRSNPRTSTVPIILLSARAGDEARNDGLDAGADDYLTKPFTARELLARVGAHIKLSRARRNAEEQSTRILESITDAFLAVDFDWRVTQVNVEAERLNGMSRSEMLGREFWDLFPTPESSNLRDEFLRAAREHVPVQFETFCAPSGRWFHMKAYPAQGGGLSVFYSDVTQSRQAEEARRRSDELLYQVFAQAPVAVAVLRGPEFVFELANPSYRELVHGRELVGRRFADALPDVVSEVQDGFRQTVETGEPYVRNDFYVRYDQNGDGLFEDHWFNVVYHPLRDGGGSVSGLVVVCSEVTAQVLARKELERANRELEEFAYVASHDLQEPLRMVNIYTELLLRGQQHSDEVSRGHAAFIHQGVSRMEALIRDLLSYSRAIHREGNEPGTASLSEALALAMQSVDTRLRETGARVVAHALPEVVGDTAQFAHVFQNLLSNSLKYRNPDVPPHIEITATTQTDRWLITVRDNGIGFDPVYAKKIFGLFKRLHNDEYSGTGLGLAICQRIVERYGGRMWAEGTPGEGAAFHFSLLRSAWRPPTLTVQQNSTSENF